MFILWKTNHISKVYKIPLRLLKALNMVEESSIKVQRAPKSMTLPYYNAFEDGVHSVRNSEDSE